MFEHTNDHKAKITSSKHGLKLSDVQSVFSYNLEARSNGIIPKESSEAMVQCLEILKTKIEDAITELKLGYLPPKPEKKLNDGSGYKHTRTLAKEIEYLNQELKTTKERTKRLVSLLKSYKTNQKEDNYWIRYNE